MLFTERHLQMVWGLRLFRREGLITEDGRSVEVEFPGIPNREAGPDFRGARLRLAGAAVSGDVELHLTSAGWEGHRHGGDPAYDGVVLHVALRRDRFHRGVRAFGGTEIPELVLEPALEVSETELLGKLAAPGARPPDQGVGSATLEAWGERRFERRVECLRLRARSLSLRDLFVREVFIGLGYRHNKAGFAELARLAPLEELSGLREPEIEARLVSAARGIPWRTRGVRPANRPRRRIAGAARWLASVGVEAPHRAHFERPEAALFDPGGAGLIGPERGAALIANVVLPLMAAVGSPDEARRGREVFRSSSPSGGSRKTRDAAARLGVRGIASLREEWGLLEYLRGL